MLYLGVRESESLYEKNMISSIVLASLVSGVAHAGDEKIYPLRSEMVGSMTINEVSAFPYSSKKNKDGFFEVQMKNEKMVTKSDRDCLDEQFQEFTKVITGHNPDGSLSREARLWKQVLKSGNWS